MRTLRYLSNDELKTLVGLARSDQDFWRLFKEEESHVFYQKKDDVARDDTLDTVELVIDFLNKNKIDHSGWTKGQLIIELRGIAREEIKKGE